MEPKNKKNISTHCRPPTTGFTLLELSLVILVIGMILALVLPNLGIPKAKLERERDIENACKSIEAISKAGIPIAGWSFGVLGVLRSFGWKEGRGGIKYKYFDYDDVRDDPPYPYGPISA